MGQLWLFWVAPIIGAIVGGIAYPLIVGPDVAADAPVTGQRSPATT
jgi:aquaporin Z